MKLAPNAYNLIVEIEESKKKELVKELSTIQPNIEDNDILPFKSVKSIHFARFVILHKSKEKPNYPNYLVFSTNYDGDLDSHLIEIINCPNADIDKIFNCCKGYENLSKNSRLDWFKENAKLKAFFYRGTWGLSTKQITYEEKSRRIAEKHVDSLAKKNLSAMELRNEIIRNASEKDSINAFKEFKLPKFNVLKALIILFLIMSVSFTGLLLITGSLLMAGSMLLKGLLFLIGSIIIVLLIFVIILIVHEFFDKQYEKTYSDHERTKKFTETEDKIVQNQLTHLVEIKPGLFRLLTLKLVLNAISLLSKYIFNKGKLGEIPTIHYARWIIIDNGKRLLFMSNFDGSWESYLGDFVDKAATGLTGVWSNTRGFPKSRFLAFKGARDEQRFKAWAREQQVHTDVWYSAYPELTVTNIANNSALQKGLTHELTDKEVEDWLQRY